MHRIYQSRRKLTASIASATKAENELLEASSSFAAEEVSLTGEKNSNTRKRPFESPTRNNENINQNSKQNCEKIESDNDGQGTSFTSSSPPHKKIATISSRDAPTSKTISSPSSSSSLTTTTTTTISIPASRISNEAGERIPTIQLASITPDSGKTTSPNVQGSVDATSKAIPETALPSHSSATIRSPDRTVVAIDLTTPSPPLRSNSEVTTVDPQPPATSTHPETNGCMAKGQQGANQQQYDDENEVEIVTNVNGNPQIPESSMDTTKKSVVRGDADTTTEAETDENDEEIQIVSSTTINPNIQYPHKRTDCGLFSFATDPSKFCEKCYCIICDIPAKECKNWGDHSIAKCRPTTKSNDDDTTDDEGYDVTDEILLESPSTTARNYYNHRMAEMDRMQRQAEENVGNRRQRQLTEAENDKKLRILDVLARKLRTTLSISEGGRMIEAMDTDSAQKKNGKPKNSPQRNSMEGDISQLGLHSAFFVEGIKIGWPFPAIMLPQRQMAMHIIKGLKRKLHVVLESPTGTGKSVAILCSVLAWQRYHMQTTVNAKSNDDLEEEEKSPRIIYCSRTHSQVTQMVASLRKTPYRPTMSVLGSRKRMCIHKSLTGESGKKNKMSLNLACQIRRMNTDSDRRRRLKRFEYDDNNPRPYEYNGDDSGENEIAANGATGIPNDTDDDEIKRPKPTCPHYRQLSSERTASMAVKRFIGAHRSRGDGGGCCGSSPNVGGEESAFGVHDMEDLIRFGKNPYKEEHIAVYRGNNGKFGFLIQNNMDDKGETLRGCHVESLVNGGAAAFEARLQNGDKLLKINGKDVRTWNNKRVKTLLSQTPTDQPARLTVMRHSSDTPELLDPQKDLFGVQDSENPADIYSESSVCPYYLSRALQRHAELTFAPYNYILDPGIRRVMGINLENAVVVLDEAHNVESTLCEGGSGKYGEIDLCQLVCTLGLYARRTANTGNITLISTQVDVDTAKVAHELLMFVENIILHLKALREKFENSPGRTKFENDYKKYRNTPDNHEVELSYDGPTGYGIKGAAVGCQPFLTQLGIKQERCAELLEYALSMEQKLFGSEDKDAEKADNGGESSNVLTVLVELLSKLLTATENAEHYYISCVVQANGNLDHAFGVEDERGNSRFKKMPRMIPFMHPRNPKNRNATLHVCQHELCNPTQDFFSNGYRRGVRHGEYCNGSIPSWECHLVLRLLSPGLLMRDLSEECRSVILASGSLAPLPSVCAELNLFGKDSSSNPNTQKSLMTEKSLPMKPQYVLDPIVEGRTEKMYTNRLQTTPKPLEANHVINLQKQLLAVSIGHFPSGEKLTVSYSNYHNNPQFLPKFGHAVASVIDGVPKGGCLVFFPSYSFLKKCVACWNQESNDYSVSSSNNNNNNNRSRYFANHRGTRDGSKSNNNFIWQRFLRSKGKVIVEPTGGQEEFEAARDDYKETIRTTGSCILLAVFRGKMSEGISFDDNNSRAVVCIGMPLPNWTDRSVKAKQAYNDEQRKLRKKTALLPGRDFYNQQAYRAIAQALGRCIRHGADYGTVILMDSRHCYDGSPISTSGVCRAHSNLPKWMRGSVHTLSMEREDRRIMMRSGQHHHQHQQPKMIYGGYAGLRKEMRRFFAEAPIASQEVRNKWKTDRERALASSSSSSNVVFHRDTGKWSTRGETSTHSGDLHKTNLEI